MSTFRKSTAREYFESILIAVILALFVRTFVVQAFKIPTGSMENNLLVGDHLLVNKFVFAPTTTRLEDIALPTQHISRGDVVVFKYPEDPERDFIKRVIGLPGEELEIRNKQVFIDGTPIEEPYVHYLHPPRPGDTASFHDVRERYGPVRVPDDHYFVMGDNRDNSQDSRWWGFLRRDYVKGRALMVYWSWESDEPITRPEGPAGWVRGVSTLVTSFFTNTRWSRLFHQIR